jgi:hypothetical protein
MKEKTQGEEERDIRSEVLNYSSFKTHKLLQWEGEHNAKKDSRCRNERLRECMREIAVRERESQRQRQTYRWRGKKERGISPAR